MADWQERHCAGCLVHALESAGALPWRQWAKGEGGHGAPGAASNGHGMCMESVRSRQVPLLAGHAAATAPAKHLTAVHAPVPDTPCCR